MSSTTRKRSAGKKFNATIPTFHGLLIISVVAFVSGAILLNMTKTYADESLAMNQITTTHR